MNRAAARREHVGGCYRARRAVATNAALNSPQLPSSITHVGKCRDLGTARPCRQRGLSTFKRFDSLHRALPAVKHKRLRSHPHRRIWPMSWNSGRFISRSDESAIDTFLPLSLQAAPYAGKRRTFSRRLLPTFPPHFCQQHHSAAFPTDTTVPCGSFVHLRSIGNDRKAGTTCRVGSFHVESARSRVR